MSLRRQKEKEQAVRSTSTIEVLLGAFISILIGFSIGFLELSFKPATTVSNLPSAEDATPETVYYINGSVSGGASFRLKEQAILQGMPGEYRFTEAELNAWVRETFRLEPTNSTADRKVDFRPNVPNFRISDGKLQIGVEVDASYDNMRRTMQFQTSGEFVQANGVWTFLPQQTWLGSAKAPPLVITPLLSKVFMGPYRSSERYAKLLNFWSSLDSVSIDGDVLVLNKS